MRHPNRVRHQRTPPPLVYRWGEPGLPLPVRKLRPRQLAGALLPGQEAPPWLETGEPGHSFDFCGHMQLLCADIAQRCEALRHIDVARLLFSVTQARNGQVHGLQARVTPLRFANGQLTRQRRGVTFQIQRYFLGATEFLYLVSFCLPRFLDQDFDEKFVTLFHELYHISPAFDGDFRRQHGRYTLHSHSQKRYDAHMAGLAREYLSQRPDAGLHAFLRLNFSQLIHRHGGVCGVVVPRPKVVRIGLAAVAGQQASHQ